MVSITTMKCFFHYLGSKLDHLSHLFLSPLFPLAPQSPIDLPFEISLNILSSLPPQPPVLLQPRHFNPCRFTRFNFLKSFYLPITTLPPLIRPTWHSGILIHLSLPSSTTCLSSTTLPLGTTRPSSLLFHQHTPCIKAMRPHQHSTSLLEGPAFPHICFSPSFKTTSKRFSQFSNHSVFPCSEFQPYLYQQVHHKVLVCLFLEPTYIFPLREQIKSFYFEFLPACCTLYPTLSLTHPVAHKGNAGETQEMSDG